MSLEDTHGMDSFAEVPESESGVMGRSDHKGSGGVGGDIGEFLVMAMELDNDFASVDVIQVGRSVPRSSDTLVDSGHEVTSNDDVGMTRQLDSRRLYDTTFVRRFFLVQITF